jgi:F-type H+-transporting ATPase subunit epsilon
MSFTLSVITPEQTVFEGEAESISVPSLDGEITILENHAPIIALLSSGEMAVSQQKQKRHMAVHGGIVQVLSNTVRILTDAAELEEDIDERRAAEALEQARKAREQAQDHVATADASAAIERAIARLQLAQKRKLRHRA